MDIEKIKQSVLFIYQSCVNSNLSEKLFDTPLEEMGADSLDRIEMMMELEESFEIEISDKDASRIGSYNETVDLMIELLTQ